jgi:hypothetical protein
VKSTIDATDTPNAHQEGKQEEDKEKDDKSGLLIQMVNISYYSKILFRWKVRFWKC